MLQLWNWKPFIRRYISLCLQYFCICTTNHKSLSWGLSAFQSEWLLRGGSRTCRGSAVPTAGVRRWSHTLFIIFWKNPTKLKEICSSESESGGMVVVRNAIKPRFYSHSFEKHFFPIFSHTHFCHNYLAVVVWPRFYWFQGLVFKSQTKNTIFYQIWHLRLKMFIHTAESSPEPVSWY